MLSADRARVRWRRTTAASRTRYDLAHDGHLLRLPGAGRRRSSILNTFAEPQRCGRSRWRSSLLGWTDDAPDAVGRLCQHGRATGLRRRRHAGSAPRTVRIDAPRTSLPNAIAPARSSVAGLSVGGMIAARGGADLPRRRAAAARRSRGACSSTSAQSAFRSDHPHLLICTRPVPERHGARASSCSATRCATSSTRGCDEPSRLPPSRSKACGSSSARARSWARAADDVGFTARRPARRWRCWRNPARARA